MEQWYVEEVLKGLWNCLEGVETIPPGDDGDVDEEDEAEEE